MRIKLIILFCAAIALLASCGNKQNADGIVEMPGEYIGRWCPIDNKGERIKGIGELEISKSKYGNGKIENIAILNDGGIRIKYKDMIAGTMETEIILENNIIRQKHDKQNETTRYTKIK